MSITDIDKYAPPLNVNKTGASSTVKVGDRESAYAERRPDEKADKDFKDHNEIDPQKLKKEFRRKINDINARLTIHGHPIRFRYVEENKKLFADAINITSGNVIRRVAAEELNHIAGKIAEMSGLLVDFKL